MTRPVPGWCTPCVVTEVIDGDTIEVEVVRRIRVRLKDCWAPESRTLNLNEKARGLAAKENMKQIGLGKPGVLLVPLSDTGDVGTMMTLGRVLGHVWVEEQGKSLSDIQVAMGFATTSKNV